MEPNTLTVASKNPDATKKFLEQTRRSQVEVFREARAAGLLRRVEITSAAGGADAGGALARRDWVIQVVDEYGASVAAVFTGKFFAIAPKFGEEWDAGLALPVYYNLAETGAGSETDTTHAGGSPSSTGGKKLPWLGFATDANGAATVSALRKDADGTTAKVTNASEAKFLGYIILDCQPEAYGQLQCVSAVDFL